MLNQNSTTLSNAAAAIGVRNRLQKDLTELQKAAAGAMTLAADDDGHLFDMGCHLRQALEALEQAVQDVERYRAAKLHAAEQAAALLNECFA